MKALRRVLPFLKPYWKTAVMAMAALALAAVVDLMIPAQIQYVIDNGIAAGNSRAIWTSTLLMVGLAVVSMVLSFFSIRWTAQVAEGFTADLRESAYTHIQNFSFSNLDTLNTSELLVRLTSDMNILKNTTMMSRLVFRAPLMLVGSLGMLIITSPRLSLVLVVLLPLTTALVYLLSTKSEAMYKTVQDMLDRVNGIMQENIAGVQVVRAFVRSDYEIQRFEGASKAYCEQSTKVNRLVAVLMPTMLLIMNLGVTAIVFFGGWMAINQTLSTGELVAFSSYLMTTMIPVLMMGMVLPQVFASEASASRILEVLDTRPDVLDNAEAVELQDVEGRIEFVHVSLDYDGEEGECEPVLKDISFVAEPGQKVAVLGATGSGKTSLVHLIGRFYDVTGGQVLIDGVDVRNVTQESLRRNVGIAMQEPLLFSGTIGDNIRFGSLEAGPAEVERAAGTADAHAFITEKEQGYSTVLGQRGKGLSGGQRQRVSIARALASNPRILILDDSTSAVDAATEARIQNALGEKTPEITQIIVAQRISTVLTADKILVLDRGQITAQGTHDDLMKSSPLYQEIYDSQLGNGNGVGTQKEVSYA